MNVTLLASDPALGSAGTLKAHAARLGDTVCVVLAAPGPVRADLDALVGAHVAAGALLTVAVVSRRPEDGPADVLIAGDDGRVMAVQPAPHPDEALSDLVDARLYVVSPAALDHVGAPPSEIGSDLLPALLAWDAPVLAHRLDG